MKSFKFTVKDPQGLHARPAGVLVKAAKEFNSKITVVKDEKEADAKRVLNLMALGIKCGTEITVNVEGEDEEKAAETLEKFFNENL
ncbi:MAG: HPr family phosphocarrier protein [Clostridium sp.]|nr:HPr family phosphocarrier protein [Clostridium sp.]MDY3828563.1 HPr family phosphocarrier protein [Clostridium sp.]